MPHRPTLPHDDVARSLHELAVHYARELATYAAVRRTYGAGAEGVRLRPVQPDAAAIGWTDLGEAIAVYVGDRPPVRLARRPETVDDLRLLCDAVVAGHGRELRGLLRSRVVLDLADGRIASLPARKRRAIAYLPADRSRPVYRRPATRPFASYR
jgi:hypothetical protein